MAAADYLAAALEISATAAAAAAAAEVAAIFTARR